MPRAKRGFKARRRRNRILKHASGFHSARSRLFAYAKEVVMKAWVYAYAHRKLKKRERYAALSEVALADAAAWRRDAKPVPAPTFTGDTR